MHKKKIEEIRGWLELQKQPGLRSQAPRMLILSGTLLSRPPTMLFTCTSDAYKQGECQNVSAHMHMHFAVCDGPSAQAR